jgi:hypothetical protein
MPLLATEKGRLMTINAKDIIRTSVREYLEGESPAKLEEFDLVFDGVYRTIEKRMAGQDAKVPSSDDGGLAFDAGVVVGTPISIACWIAAILVKGFIKGYAKEELPKRLDKIESALASRTNQPELVHRLRRIVERTLQNL